MGESILDVTSILVRYRDPGWYLSQAKELSRINPKKRSAWSVSSLSGATRAKLNSLIETKREFLQVLLGNRKRVRSTNESEEMNNVVFSAISPQPSEGNVVDEPPGEGKSPVAAVVGRPLPLKASHSHDGSQPVTYPAVWGSVISMVVGERSSNDSRGSYLRGVAALHHQRILVLRRPDWPWIEARLD